MFARWIHGAVPIELDHRFVTRRATSVASVAFVCFCHRPEIFVSHRLLGVAGQLHFNFSNAQFC
jgi:hypothetical protein